ncbi:hypothetical protein [Paenibacillus sp. N3.4]|uniref:hypothetical protein n=1 Tax=Paenibacillus sp. N3.4 TaxID=2603222 RepID=UPI0021C35887|nr:hypothetical protein [Paenibacillus sp. N3.4]
MNAIAPIAIKEATKQENDGEKKDNKTNEFPVNEDVFKNSAPQLTTDIKIEKVAVKATVNASNYIQHQEADLTISGKDDNGTAHQVVIHVQADLTGINSTTPETIDLTGKTVQQLKHGQEGKHHNDN